MAVIPSVAAPVAQPAWSPGQWANQVVGVQGHPVSDRGIPEHLPQYGPDVAPAVPDVAYNPFTESLDHIYGPEYSGAPIDHTSTVTGHGPSVPYTTFPYALDAHSADRGGPAAARHAPRLDVGDPALRDTQMANSDWLSNRTAPRGEVTEVPGQFEGHNLQWSNTRNLGYTYVGYDERPLYNTLAAVSPELDGAHGVWAPDGSYSRTVYNDGGIPPAYSNPPDPPVGPQAQTTADPMGMGFINA